LNGPVKRARAKTNPAFALLGGFFHIGVSVTLARREREEDVEHRWAEGRKRLGIRGHIDYSISTMDIFGQALGTWWQQNGVLVD
jgi:hypothetical protein